MLKYRYLFFIQFDETDKFYNTPALCENQFFFRLYFSLAAAKKE